MKRWLYCAVMFLMVGCIEPPNQFEMLPPGQWRGVLKLSDRYAKGQPGLVESDKKLLNFFELPFNFEIEYEADGEMVMYLINGDERTRIEALRYGRDPATARDTIQVTFAEYDSYLDAFYEDNYIEGYWKVPYRGEDYQIPFEARYGDTIRFENPGLEDNYNFAGRWRVEFAFGTPDAYLAIREFDPEDTHLKGTFLTETGDFRYLEGIAYGEKMKLSVFDGAHAFLFSGNVTNDTILGEFRSGSHYKTQWRAYRDADFELANPYDLTQSMASEPVDFGFESLDGTIVRLTDDRFKNKIKLVNIMGSWCPNCRDEIEFLKTFAPEHPEIEIISIAFEKYRDPEKAKSVLRRYRQAMGIEWPLLYGGYADKKETGENFKFLDRIYAYPTLLVIDKNNRIAGVQTGFYGPATSEHEEFKQNFYNILEQIKQ